MKIKRTEKATKGDRLYYWFPFEKTQWCLRYTKGATEQAGGLIDMVTNCCAYDRWYQDQILDQKLVLQVQVCRQQIQDNALMMINGFFKLISFRNGKRCKYGGSRHKSILLARSLTAYADVQPRLEIGIKAERVCDIVTLWHSRWRSSAYIWMLLFSFSFSIYAPFLQLSLQGHGSRNSLLKSWKTSNSSFFPSLAWVGQILRRSD